MFLVFLLLSGVPVEVRSERSSLMLSDNLPIKILIPQNELELNVKDLNIQNETQEQITLLCIKAKNMTKTIPGCGKNFCGIGIKFFNKSSTNMVEAHFGADLPVNLTLLGGYEAKLKIDSTKFMDEQGRNLMYCSWDDHDGKYLIGKAVNFDHRTVELISDGWIHDEPSSVITAKDNKWITPLHIPSKRSMNITIPKNDLVLFVVNKQNGGSRRDTIFCFEAKNKTDDMICGNGFCGIRMFFSNDHNKLQHVIYGNVIKQRSSVSNLPSITTFWINKTTITNSDFNETSSSCEWDDHGGKYLTVELVEHENTKVYLMGSEFYRAPDPLTENYEYVECCEGANQHRYSFPNVLTFQNLQVSLMIFLTETFLLLVLRIIYGILVIQKLRRKIIYVTPTLNFDESYFDQN